jgi:predicted cupin superfamily sugar epimerase
MKTIDLIDKLNMMAHPEGGYYRRNWQSLLTGDIKDNTEKCNFPNRVIGSSILYLLPERWSANGTASNATRCGITIAAAP